MSPSLPSPVPPPSETKPVEAKAEPPPPKETGRHRVKVTLPVTLALVILAGFKKLPPSHGMPVLRHVLVHSVGWSMTNLDTFATHRLESAPAAGRGFTVPLSHLLRFLEGADKTSPLTLAAEVVRFDRGEGHAIVKATVAKRGLAMSSDLHGLPEEAFPTVPETTELVPQVFDASSQDAIAECLPFASSDIARGILNSLLVNPKEGAIAATDGRRLQVFEGFSWRNLKSPLLLPTPSARLLLSLTDRKAGQVWRLRKAVSGNLLHVAVGPWSLACKLEQGVFPNFRQVIPKWEGRRGYATLTPSEVKHLAETVPLMPPADYESKGSDSERAVMLTLNGEFAVGLANNKVVSTARTRYCPPPDDTRGYAFVSVRQDYLLDALTAGHTEVSVATDMDAVFLRGPGRLHVLMPLRAV